MKAKLALAAGLGIGYILGARAGRGRFEQIRRGWEGFAESEPVQRAVEPVKEAAQPITQVVTETVQAARTGTEDLPEPQGLAALSADQVKERLSRTGSITDTHDHLPEEIVKERM